jgi:hypothetical protein
MVGASRLQVVDAVERQAFHNLATPAKELTSLTAVSLRVNIQI